MKDKALQLVKETPEPQKANLLWEYLQAHILYSLQGKRAFEQLAFVDGTALRFIYGIPRFSEDLDFSLERKTGYSFDTLLQAAERDLTKAGFEVTVYPRTGKTVHSAFFRFPGLLYEAGLSPHRAQKLSIKVEIDTNPPPGAKTEQTVINRHFLLGLWHHDLPSLMAGKIHALLMRSYTKGRDLYDLLWYLTRSEPVVPNIVLLNNALQQTGWKDDRVTNENWRSIIGERLEQLDWISVSEDVSAFLEHPAERSLLTKRTLLAALERAEEGID